MPPLLPFIPEILSAASVGLGIDKQLQGPPKPAPITSIPGSPQSVVHGTSGAASGPTSLPPNGVLGQVLGTSGPLAAATGAAPVGGAGGGGGGKSTTTPGVIGGGTAPDFNTLPWFQQNAGSPVAQPGTPSAI